ncbi:MAG: CoA ester lyase [Rhodospirillales bacterium]
MSLHTPPQRPTRPNRSQLTVPGSSPRFIDKAQRLAADIVLFDLEDAVPVGEKENARRTIAAAINDLDWGERTLSVRINGLDTPFMYRDLIEVVEQAGERLDLVMIPKVAHPADIYTVDVLLTQIEAAKRRTKRIGIEAMIESALGMENVGAIAAASPRLESLHFGSGDFAASTGIRTLAIGGDHPDYTVLGAADASGRRPAYPGDVWHYALARLVVAARAHGLRPVDGPFAGIGDDEGFLAAAKRAAALGCAGKWVLHPSQVELANAVFTPSAEELKDARAILGALADAGAAGKAALTLGGRMIDIASIRQAEAMVRTYEAIARLAPSGGRAP